jgi:hypothetical protein
MPDGLGSEMRSVETWRKSMTKNMKVAVVCGALTFLLVLGAALAILKPWQDGGGSKLNQAEFTSQLTSAGIQVDDPGKSYAMAGVYCQAWKDGQPDAESSAKQLARLALALSETHHDNVDELVETYWSAVKRAC